MASGTGTIAALAVSAIDLGTFTHSLPRDPASLTVLALALGAVALVVIAHVKRTGHEE